jgi:hypothetical protein
LGHPTLPRYANVIHRMTAGIASLVRLEQPEPTQLGSTIAGSNSTEKPQQPIRKGERTAAEAFGTLTKRARGCNCLPGVGHTQDASAKARSPERRNADHLDPQKRCGVPRRPERNRRSHHPH